MSITVSAIVLGGMDIHACDVAELFSPGRFAEKASAFALVPGSEFDLRTGWDLASEAGRQDCWRTLHAELPELVVGSPPCTAFSTLQFLSGNSARRRAAEIEGICFITFVCAVYAWQVERGCSFLHEHRWGAWFFRLECVQATLQLPGATLVR